jgi:hypothetical protein
VPPTVFETGWILQLRPLLGKKVGKKVSYFHANMRENPREP